eukprot:m.224841 g.224841  ORF g.224841 m.224841 type:complete len:705 (-) comp11160_c0_seq1:70-2184(-)
MSVVHSYPAARRDDSVTDEYHGTHVADPYRYLEDPDAEETKAFVQAQNAISEPFLKGTDVREKFSARMTELYNYPKYSCPFKRGQRYFYYFNTGLQNHSVLYMQDSLDGEPRVLIDPNTLSEDGTTAMQYVSFSDDGRYLAYGLSEKGSDWATLKVRDVETGADLPDVLKWVKFSCLSWTHDGKGFFYNRYAQPQVSADAGTETETNVNQKLCYHVLGQAQDDDVLVYDMPEHPKWMSGLEVTDDGQYFILTISEGCDPVNRLLYAPAGPITGRIEFTKVVDNFDAQYEYISNDGPIFTFKTNLTAPRYRLIRADLTQGEAVQWTDVIPEAADVLEWAAAVNDTQLVLAYLRDVKSVLELRELESGKEILTFPLDVGHVPAFSGRRRDNAIFYKFTSFLEPGTIYRVDLTALPLTPVVFRTTTITGFDASRFTTSQVFVTSKDGTKFPMFIVSRKDTALDGANPTLLYGYGGFNISITPSFSVSRVILCQNLGGILAIANIRGGGEYGETWHKAGSLAHKQNVFDDFQAAAEYLIAHKYTSPAKLAINGASNGGLLVAACVNQRPDLFGCALASVGVMDMLRFHKFTIGHAWCTDYGCSDKADEFEWLIKYSPLHNVRPAATQYPAILILTGDHDDRVVPLHSLKLIATLQHVIGSLPNQTNPIMARIEVAAGHGAGKPTKKIIDEVADMYAFFARTLGAVWTD